MNGELILVLLAMCARTRRCFPSVNQLRLGKRCTWETRPHLESKAKEMWSWMTSGNELTLTNVLYIPEIYKNLVSSSLLNSYGFRLVFESDKFVLSNSRMYIGNGI